MSEVIFITIVPSKPSTAAAFASVLDGITIDVYDLKPQDSKNGTLIGSAAGVLTTAATKYETSQRDGIQVVTKAILQHYDYVENTVPGHEFVVSNPIVFNAVATAVVLINRPAGFKEYPTDDAYDIRLRVQKDSAIDIPTVTEYNIAGVQTLNVSGNDTALLVPRITSVFRQPAAANVVIPAYGSVNIPSADVGTVNTDLQKAPPFESMITAVNKVLKKNENVTLDTRPTPLTAAESQHVASEIVWNRMLRPPPDEPNDQTLALWYTADRANVDQDQQRQKYENEVLAYQQTLKADSLRLANYVFSTSAAVEAERKTWAAVRAELPFPIKSSIQTATSFSSRALVLQWTGSGPNVSRFPVPAAFFYAIASSFTPGITSDQRYDTALATDEARLVVDMQAAVDNDVIVQSEPFSLLAQTSSINLFQACRRIVALGQADSLSDLPDAPLPSSPQIPSYESIVTKWLAFSDSSSLLDSGFWGRQAGAITQDPQGYLALILWLVTKGSVDLIVAIVKDKPQGLGVKTADALSNVTDSQWRQFFGVEPMNPADPLLSQAFPNLLPPFTQPGGDKQRVQAWILSLQKIFSVSAAPVAATPPQSTTVSDFNRPPGDLLTQFIMAYAGAGAFTFTNALDAQKVKNAISTVFPTPAMEKERACLSKMVYTMSDLFRMTDIEEPNLQFSLMEALYSRGVISMETVAVYSFDLLRNTLRGTVAFSFASQIRSRAREVLGLKDSGGETPGEQFVPINPDGRLVNCIPSQHLSPFGEIQYLHDLLRLKPDDTSISTLMENTRGNLDLLSASPANQDIAVPLIDLVNESLEALASHPNTPVGQIYDTSSNPLVSKPPRLEALPENSSPAFQVKNTLAYENLRKSFDAPELPYSQFLDVNRTFLGKLETSRFQVLRTFRRDTTDFPQTATDATRPDGFESHRWRLPCAFDVALECLCISHEEYETLYTSTPIDEAHLRLMYGFPPAPARSSKFALRKRIIQSAADLVATAVNCTPSDTPAPDWDPNGHWYAVGDLVRYEGRLYAARQAHASQAGWQPGTRPDGVANAPGIWHTPTPCGITEWHIQTHYQVGSVVTFEGLYYVCRLEHSSDAPNWTPLNFPVAWVRGGDPDEPENPNPVDPQPEHPEPEHPEPEHPEPEHPEPEHPEPEHSEPEHPEPEPPEPEHPQPEHPEPEHPQPEQPEDPGDWTEIITHVDEFLRRTGLSYCQFLELVASGFIKDLGVPTGGYPDCEPCCVSKLRVVLPAENPIDVLRRIIIFVRLWRSLRCSHSVSFAVLAKVCTSLKLFVDAQAAVTTVNADFIRQLASFFMMLEHFKMPFETLLSLYSSASPTRAVLDKAAEVVVKQLEDLLVRQKMCRKRSNYTKLLVTNFDALSELSGFFGINGTWNQLPTHTIRFLEVLCHFCESPFNVGDVTFLFTTRDHLAGEDPFPLQDKNEAIQDPLQIPEDSHYDLWALRRKLRKVEVGDDECERWDWPKVLSSLDYLGYKDVSAVQTLAEHFFPSILESCGYSVNSDRRRFVTSLTTTDIAVWNQPYAPFRLSGDQLSAHLPIKDEELLNWLRKVRPLRTEEQRAVRELYFAPRSLLAPYAAIFEDFSYSVTHLVSAETDKDRWRFFRRQFAKFFKRCEIIAGHLAQHMAHKSNHQAVSCDDHALAWEILRRLVADENYPTPESNSAWEPTETRPNALPTQFLWETKLAGGAFAAILGLLGSGLVQDFYAQRNGRQLVWREMSSNLDVFGHPLRNKWNYPLPTILPSLQSPADLQSNRFITTRNGLAIRDMDDQLVGGFDRFEVHWSGFLLIECSGNYSFKACRPGCEADCSCSNCSSRWTVVLRRGQKEWKALNHTEEFCDALCNKPSDKHWLQKGAYEIDITFWQEEPDFANSDDADEHVKPVHTGFRLQYCGPDSEGFETIPHDMLFVDKKISHLADGVFVDADSQEHNFLRHQYHSTFRDVRRTYQRAFKALLLSRKFDLSAAPERSCDDKTEIQYFLDNAALFAGKSYFRPQADAKYLKHVANFDFNLLPVSDSYAPPSFELDTRVQPTPQRQAALFDWFERLFQYTSLRKELKLMCLRKPLWTLFYEAKSQNPIPPNQLVLHLGIDVSAAPVTLTYMPSDSTGTQRPFMLASTDLTDERWVYRVWKSGQWLKQVQKAFYSRKIEDVTPALWVASAGTLSNPSQLVVGNFTLQKFVYDGLLPGPGKPSFPDGIGDLTAISNELRKRARTALVAYLCNGNKISLAQIGGTYAVNSSDLSNFLLIDVDCEINETITRIADAIQAVQTLVQRVLLDLRPKIVATPRFVHDWRTTYETFCGWKAWKKREVYHENWIQYDEAAAAIKSESFKWLEGQLRQGTHSITVPTASKWWDVETDIPGAGLFQSGVEAQLSLLQDISSVPDEGLSLMAVPQNHGRPNWVTSPGDLQLTADPVPTPKIVPTTVVSDAGSTNPEQPTLSRGASSDAQALTPQSESLPTGAESSTSIPLWIQSAIRMGTRFIRVAAAGPPVAITYPPAWCLKDFRGQECCTSTRDDITVDEYWFWMADGSHYKDNRASQNADIGSKDRLDPTSDWDKPNQLPTLLHWKGESLTYLYWTRVRQGKFDPLRMSDDGVPLPSTSTTPASLEFVKRDGDSLFFTVNGAEARPGYPTPNSQPAQVQTGFRYIMPEDRSIVIPDIETKTNSTTYPASLKAFPYFIFFDPGAEIFQSSKYSVTLTVATALRARCCFESALKWCQLASNPLVLDNKWEYCKKRPRGELQVNSTDAKAQTAHADEPCCSQIAKDSKVARRRAATLLYLEIILDWANSDAAKANHESLRQAQVLLEAAARLLGSRPETVLSTTRRNEVAPSRLRDFVPSPAPLNPRLLAIYDQVNDKGTYLRGRISSSRRLQPTCSLCASPSPRGMTCWDCSCVESASSYRFTYLLSKALEMTGILRSLSSSLLSAYEKGDAEYLSALRATHEKQIQVFTLETRENQWRESDWQVQALDKQMEIAQTNLRYYRDLISRGLIGKEKAYEVATQLSMTFRGSSTGSDTIAESVGSVPDMWFGIAGTMGTPLQFQQMPVGVKMAHGFSTAARILNTFAEQYTTQGSLGLTQAGWERREDEWRHSVDTTSIEIEQLKRQLLAAKRRVAISLQELNIQRRQIEQADELHDFLREKFTNQDLYLFLQNETAQLHHQAYKLAALYAQDALGAFLKERGDYTSPLSVQQTSSVEMLTKALQAGAGSLREGLMAGETLEMGLHFLERGFLSANVREYELTKHISLRTLLPLEFLFLKMTGKCTFTIPEWLFDLEYPGQYMRRIKSVSLTVPCVTGPYAGIRSRLKLISSTTRISPELVEGPKKCCADGDECQCGHGYAIRDSEDARFLRCYHHNGRPDVHTSTMIATSTGISDSGMFETNLRQDERYLPFELCGVAGSTWEIEIPHENNSFDFHSLSDVVLHVNYTAREGGDALRAAAWKSAQTRLPDGGMRYFDARQDLAEMWYRCFTREDRRQISYDHDRHGQHGNRHHDHHVSPMDHQKHGQPRPSFPIRFTHSMFPFIPTSRLSCNRGKICIERIDIFVEATGPRSTSLSLCCCDMNTCKSSAGHLDLIFQPPGCCEPHVDFPSIVRCEWGQGVYHGVLEWKDKNLGIDIGLVKAKQGDGVELGELFFPHGVRTAQMEKGDAKCAAGRDAFLVENVHFVVGYVVEGLSKSCYGGKRKLTVKDEPGSASRGDGVKMDFW